MGEDQHRRSVPAQSSQDARLGRGVERRGRLVEQQDGPVGEQRAGDGNALALTDLRLNPDRNLGAGVTRLLVLDYGMSPSQRGPMLQRLFELETYRMLALLALRLAQRSSAETFSRA